MVNWKGPSLKERAKDFGVVQLVIILPKGIFVADPSFCPEQLVAACATAATTWSKAVNSKEFSIL